MNTTKTAGQISSSFHKLVNSDAKIHNAHLLVHSNASGLHLSLADGDAQTGGENAVHTGQPVYMASVGKLFTAVLVAILCEQGTLSFEDRIVDFLDPNLLKGLHVCRGTDYTQQIQLKHLLNHTSGLQDYFEDKPAKGPGMVERLLIKPDRAYLPQEIVMWSKEYLKSHFPPGKGFHYSDTGYQILGLVVETVTGMPFPSALSRLLFGPLEAEISIAALGVSSLVGAVFVEALKSESSGLSMTVIYPLTAAQEPVSGPYQQVLHWTVKDKPARAIQIQILTVLVFLLLGLAFSFLAIHIGKLPHTRQFGLLEVGVCPVGLVATIVLHELVHGLAMRLCGAKPQYGVLWKQFMFYATSPGYGFRRNTYLLVMLAPLVGISCLLVLGMFLLQGTSWVALLALYATVNGSGAFGDVWLVSLVLRYPRGAYVVDERDGVRVLIRKT